MKGYTPVKHAERCPHCGVRYVYLDRHEARCPRRSTGRTTRRKGEVGHEPFDDPRLTPQQNKACEMLFNGISRDDIADELDIEDRTLRRLFWGARQRGVAVPFGESGNTNPNSHPIAKLLELRDELVRAGVKRGVYPIIAERLGMTANAVKVRIWKHFHPEGRAA